ncbi:protein Mdm4 isoform X2 [Electrophorus electricus]|uniref:Protein Mdm4 n=1 Tax=Electrophorus electricus TaxID=8005 RepID=A0A4W4GN00_ELEEL|nr:protein Mdm4 isoform X2 [Electrophorus electricus]
MTSLSATLHPGSGSSCRALPGEGSQVQPKAPLLQILRVGGAQEEVFTLKEVMHYLGQYIIVKELYDKQRQHIVHCQDDPLGELLEVESFSVKNPSPVYEMLKRNLFILNGSDAAKNVSVGKDSNESPCEDPGQVSSSTWGTGQGLSAGTVGACAAQSSSQRRPRDTDEDSLDGLPRSACKRPKLDVSLEEWDLSGLPWWFLGNLRNNYTRRSNGSTDLHTNQEEDTAIVSDTTDDLWFLNEAESEQVSVEMKEAALEQGSDTESPPPEEEQGRSVKEDKEMQDELDEDSQCLSDDTDTEISTQDAWQCAECRKFNSPLQRYCMRCWAMRKDWYKDCPRLAPSVSVPDIAACGPALPAHEDEDAGGVDVPDCPRTVSDPVVLPSHRVSRNLPPRCGGSSKGKAPARALPGSQESSESESQELLDGEAEGGRQVLLEPCRLCRMRPRDGNIIHGRTAHMITCFPCARKLHRFHAPCPGCGQVIQKVIKMFIA